MIFNPKRSLGQNFLVDDKILNKIKSFSHGEFNNETINHARKRIDY